MNRALNSERQHTLQHSHSTMTRLLEEIDAHVDALSMDSDARDAILQDLEHFTQLFAEDVKSHIREEESALFPEIRVMLDGSNGHHIDLLVGEHREIETAIDDLMQCIARYRQANSLDYPVDNLKRRVRLLNYAFVAHSNHERLVLQRAEDVLNTR